MIKKGFLISSVIITTACIFSACVSRNSEELNGQEPDKVRYLHWKQTILKKQMYRQESRM